MFGEYILRVRIIKGLKYSIQHKIHSIWISNKHVTAQDLAQPSTSVSNLQNASYCGNGTCISNKPRICFENRKNQEATQWSLKTMENRLHASTAQLTAQKAHPWWWCNIPDVKKYSSSRSSILNYAFVTFFPSNVDYCRSFRAHFHCASTCHFVSDLALSLIINQRHLNLANLLPRNPYLQGNQGPRCSGKFTPNSFRLSNKTLKRNDGVIHNTHSPKKRIPLKNGEIPPSTRMSPTVRPVGASSAQTASMPLKN